MSLKFLVLEIVQKLSEFKTNFARKTTKSAKNVQQYY